MLKSNIDRLEILSRIEPFLELDLASTRKKLIDDTITENFREEIGRSASNLSTQEKIELILNLISEIKTEIHYLKAAYIEKCRYQDPKFEIISPTLTPIARPDVFEIDMRAEITGSNWWHSEPIGRWAGPENQSSIQLPALGHGRYNIEIYVVHEIDEGIIENMQTTLNGIPIELKRETDGFPCKISTALTIPESYRLPFWSINLKFDKIKAPREKGLPDDRKLAIMVGYVRITRLDN